MVGTQGSHAKDGGNLLGQSQVFQSSGGQHFRRVNVESSASSTEEPNSSSSVDHDQEGYSSSFSISAPKATLRLLPTSSASSEEENLFTNGDSNHQHQQKKDDWTLSTPRPQSEGGDVEEEQEEAANGEDALSIHDDSAPKAWSGPSSLVEGSSGGSTAGRNSQAGIRADLEEDDNDDAPGDSKASRCEQGIERSEWPLVGKCGDIQSCLSAQCCYGFSAFASLLAC